MGDTEELIAFCEARLAEEEARATALLEAARQAIEALKDPRLLGCEIPGWHSWPDVEAMCLGMLRDVEAKRALLRRHEEDRHHPGQCPNCFSALGEHLRWPCPTFRIVAGTWSAHPGYREVRADFRISSDPSPRSRNAHGGDASRAIPGPSGTTSTAVLPDGVRSGPSSSGSGPQ